MISEDPTDVALLESFFARPEPIFAPMLPDGTPSRPAASSAGPGQSIADMSASEAVATSKQASQLMWEIEARERHFRREAGRREAARMGGLAAHTERERAAAERAAVERAAAEIAAAETVVKVKAAARQAAAEAAEKVTAEKAAEERAAMEREAGMRQLLVEQLALQRVSLEAQIRSSNARIEARLDAEHAASLHLATVVERMHADQTLLSMPLLGEMAPPSTSPSERVDGAGGDDGGGGSEDGDTQGASDSSVSRAPKAPLGMRVSPSETAAEGRADAPTPSTTWEGVRSPPQSEKQGGELWAEGSQVDSEPPLRPRSLNGPIALGPIVTARSPCSTPGRTPPVAMGPCMTHAAEAPQVPTTASHSSELPTLHVAPTPRNRPATRGSSTDPAPSNTCRVLSERAIAYNGPQNVQRRVDHRAELYAARKAAAERLIAKFQASERKARRHATPAPVVLPPAPPFDSHQAIIKEHPACQPEVRRISPLLTAAAHESRESSRVDTPPWQPVRRFSLPTASTTRQSPSPRWVEAPF